ncbi:hypothetical protein E4U34_007969 [Claviceps purpurea]|nr:hypothetical protein E4U28_000361 [Claviceps purpurea]KAG6207811.1 hypothetical protein E4U34_007969 [Claviceps purpurea]
MLILRPRPPIRRPGPKADHVRPDVKQRAESKRRVHGPVAGYEALNDPDARVYALVELQLPQLGDELAHVFSPDTELRHFPVYDLDGRWGVLLEGSIG